MEEKRGRTEKGKQNGKPKRLERKTWGGKETKTRKQRKDKGNQTQKYRCSSVLECRPANVPANCLSPQSAERCPPQRPALTKFALSAISAVNFMRTALYSSTLKSCDGAVALFQRRDLRKSFRDLLAGNRECNCKKNIKRPHSQEIQFST